jgi:hypothetical protein
MVKPFPYIALFGDSFSPAKLEQETGLKFDRKHEVGQIGQRGRFKGKPFSFGHAILEAPENIEPEAKLEWLLDIALPHTETFRRLGITCGKIHVTYAYDSQCNLEYEPEIVEKIARLGLSFTVTCYQDESEFE